MKTERFRDKRIRPTVPGTKMTSNPESSYNLPKTTNKAQCVSWDYKCDPADRKVESLTTKCTKVLNKRMKKIIIRVRNSRNIDIDTETDKAIYKAYNYFNDTKYKNKRIQVILKYPKGRFTFNYKLTDNISLGFLKKITQKKGNFDFGNQFFSETNDCKKLQSLIILGAGSDNTFFVTTDSNIHAINGSNITGNISFKGITFSRDQISSSQGKITNNDFKVKENISSLTIKIDPGFPSIKELLQRKKNTVSIKLYTGKPFNQGNYIHKYNQDGTIDRESDQARIINVLDFLPSSTTSDNSDNYDKVIIKVAAENKMSWQVGDNIAIKIKSGGFPYYLWGENGKLLFVDIKWTHKTRGIIRGRWDRVYMDRIHIPNTSVNNIRPYIASSGGGPQIGGETDGYKCDFVKHFTLTNSTIMNSGDDNLGLFHIQNCEINNIVTSNAFGRNILFHQTPNCLLSNITTDLEGRFEYNFKNKKGLNELLNPWDRQNKDGKYTCMNEVLENVPERKKKNYSRNPTTDIVKNEIHIPLNPAIAPTNVQWKLFTNIVNQAKDEHNTKTGKIQQKFYEKHNNHYKKTRKIINLKIKVCNGKPEYSYCNHLRKDKLINQCDLPGQKEYCPGTCGGVCSNSGN